MVCLYVCERLIGVVKLGVLLSCYDFPVEGKCCKNATHFCKNAVKILENATLMLA